MEDIESIFEERRAAALTIWERYELRKAELQELGLTQKEYEIACRQLADRWGSDYEYDAYGQSNGHQNR
jgi:hypothetical protein